ncbi:MAG: insulinase family protein [Bdellovibrionales bacterium]|nr:insulinase family protein [Bdellovibrionales bacterium]
MGKSRLFYGLASVGLILLVACSKKSATNGTGANVNVAPKGILTLPHETTTLENGLKVFLVKYPSTGVVAYQLGVRVGSRNEVEAGKSGFAHFFEHLMFRGTKTLSSQEFGAIYTENGVSYNAWTWYDMTNYHGEVASRYLDKILAAEADRFQNLDFTEAALKAEAGAVLGEYLKSASDPGFLMEETMQELAYKSHTYGHTTMGYKADIEQYPNRYQDVWPFFKRYYRPSNVRIVLVGDIEFDKALELVRAKFGAWENPADQPQAVTPEPEQTSERSRVVEFPSPTPTRIGIAYKVPAFGTQNVESAALKLLVDVYFSETSEFQKTYRFEKGWLDSVSATPLETVDPGLWKVELILSDSGKDKEAELKQAVFDVIAKIQSSPADAAELAAAKTRSRNAALTRWFSAPDALAGQINWYTNFEADFAVLDRLFQRIDEVQPSDVVAFAKKYLVAAKRTTVTLRGKVQ